MKKIIIAFVSFLFSIQVYSQIDTEFWFAAPDLVGGHWEDQIQLCLVTYDQPTVVRIYQPANMNSSDYFYFAPIEVSIPANSAKTIPLGEFVGSLETLTMVTPFGLHIVSESPITAYYFCTGASSDLYSLKGSNALGVDFIVPMQYTHQNSSRYPTAFSTIEVLATEDNTEVAFQFQQRTTVTGQAIATMTKHLAYRGQTYAVKALNQLGNRHLHNTRITTNHKPIVVNSTDDAVKGIGIYPCDLIGDQIVPISYAGTEYIAVKNNGLIENVFIFPTENNTQVSIDGVFWKTLNVGESDYYSFPSNKEAVFISSSDENKPLIVFQVTSEGEEVAGTMLPKLGCTGSSETAFLSVLPDPYVTILTKKDFINDFTVNDDPAALPASVFTIINYASATEEWAFCRKKINPDKDGIIRIKNNVGYFHMGVMNGDGSLGGGRCSYGYFSDYRSIRLRPQLSQDYFVSGDTLVLSLSDASALENIVWEAPNGSIHYGSPVSIYPIDESYSGEYKVTATTKDACGEVPAAYLTINIYKTHEEYGLCHGEDITLTAPGHAPYIWAHDSSLPDTTSTIIVSPDDTTHYVVKNNRSGGNILVNGDFQKLAFNNQVRSDYLNGGTSPSAVATPGRYAITNNASLVSPDYSKVYDCSDYPNSGRHMVVNTTAETGKRIWVDTIDVKQNTSYTLSANLITAKENGIPAQIYFSVNGVSVSNVITPPNTKPAGSPANIAYGTKKEHWQHYTSNVWQSGLHTKAVISIATDQFNSEGASLCIDNINFAPEYQVSDTLTVNVEDSPTPKIIGDDIICHGQAILSVEAPQNNSPYTQYNWYLLPDGENPISTDPQLIVTQGGSYMVQVFTANGCSGIDAKTLPPIVEIDATLQPQVEVCDDAPHYTLSYKISSMELVHYNITYDAQAQSAGFVNQTDIPITSKDEITITMPSDIAPGVYNAQVQLISNSTCGDSKTLPVEITVRIGAHKLIAQKWNEVLSLYNADNNPGGYNYQSQQWYKNGEILYGETGTNLYIPGGLNPNDSYSVLLTLEDGRVIMTCGFIPESREDNNSLPTIASISQEITIKLDEWLYNNGTVQAVFTTVSGVVYSRQELSTAYSTLRYPDRVGLYILEITSSMGKGVYKVFLEFKL